jgi:hypothetical protein
LGVVRTPAPGLDAAVVDIPYGAPMIPSPGSPPMVPHPPDDDEGWPCCSEGEDGSMVLMMKHKHESLGGCVRNQEERLHRAKLRKPGAASPQPPRPATEGKRPLSAS